MNKNIKPINPLFNSAIDSFIFDRILSSRSITSSTMYAAPKVQGILGEGLVINHEWDNTNSYKYNSSGYRSPEFTTEVDILVAGCSFTHGDGVPFDYIWGSIVAESLNSTYANIGTSGGSIYQIVQDIYKYISTYGAPKTLLCLFPDPNRVLVPPVSGLSVGHDTNIVDMLYQGYALYGAHNAKEAPLYIKKPYKIDEIVSKELATMLSVNAIYAIHDFCKALGTRFIWSTWDIPFSRDIVPRMNIDSYIDIENNLWTDKLNSGTFLHKSMDYHDCPGVDCRYLSKCHELELIKYPKNFHIGTDSNVTKYGRRSSHWGIHRHIHIAEIFLDILSS